MRRTVRIIFAGLPALVLMLHVAAPLHASSFGKPNLYVIAGKIAPPYSSAFNLQTGVSSWPALLSPASINVNQATVSGGITIWVQPDVFDTLVNEGRAFAKPNGIYGVSTEMADLVGVTSYVGMFAYSQIYQDFVKDSIGAYCNFHVGYLYPTEIYSRATFVDDVRSEFAIDISGFAHAATFSSFHQDGGVRAWAGPAGPTLHSHVTHGPMTYSDLHPGPQNYDEKLVFDPITGSLDLSTLSVGDTFEVRFAMMSQVAWIPGDNPRGWARLIDPAGSGGISAEIAGVHAIDTAVNPILAVGDPAPGRLASLSPPRPNPARGAVAFTLEASREGDYIVDVFDLSGRRRSQLANGRFGAGSHVITWNPGGADRERLPAGVYFVRAKGPGLDAVRRVVRVAER